MFRIALEDDWTGSSGDIHGNAYVLFETPSLFRNNENRILLEVTVSNDHRRAERHKQSCASTSKLN